MHHDPIEVRTWGEGPREIVLLHGGPGAPGSAASLARLLADDFRVLEPLQRGSGDVPLTVARHVADLAAVAPSPAVLVGCSWGAMLALSFAAAHPDRVRGLVLVGCGTYDAESRSAYEAAMRERLGPDGVAEAEELQRRIAATDDEAERNAIFAALGDLATRAQAYEPLPDEGEGEVACDLRAHEETWDDALRLQEEGQEPLAFSAVSAPVCMLHGADDPHPGRAIHATLGEFLPQIEYVEIDRCGHEPWRERHAREAFLASLRERLGRLTGTGA